jgi:hypothetical protein
VRTHVDDSNLAVTAQGLAAIVDLPNLGWLAFDAKGHCVHARAALPHDTYTKITDRSMQLLSNIRSLEDISFYGCPVVTDAGVVMLARLPRLRRLEATGPQITSACQAAFSARVKTWFTEDSDE